MAFMLVKYLNRARTGCNASATFQWQEAFSDAYRQDHFLSGDEPSTAAHIPTLCGPLSR